MNTTNKSIVLISHFNSPESLFETLDSILSEENIDLLVVDDGSKIKPSIQEITNHFKANGKVHYLELIENVGLAKALNAGLKYIQELNQHIYIARLDNGDLNIGNRFKIQETFLDKNPNIYLLGSNVEVVDLQRKYLFDIKLPELHNDIKKKMHYNSSFMHPSVIFRVAILESVGFYPENYDVAEDFAYFSKIIKKHQTYNLQQNLIKYEINPNGISVSKRRRQIKQRLMIILKNFDFTIHSFLGLFWTIAIFLTPDNLIFKLKKLFFKK